MIQASGVQHVGIPVSNLKQSLNFYKKVFGVEPEFVAEGSGEQLSHALAVPAAVLSFAFLHIGSATVELLEYKNPRGKPYRQRNCDIGATHVAFRVSDIESSYSKMAAAGITFNAPPLRISDGPLAGSAFVYFTDPDGLSLELFQEGDPT